MKVNKDKLPNKPVIPKHFYIIPMSDNKIQFRTAGKTTILKGRAVKTLFPLLIKQCNGKNSLNEIFKKLNKFSKEDILTALFKLNEKGLLEDSGIKIPSVLPSEELNLYNNQIKFFSLFDGGNKYECQKKLKESSVCIFEIDEIGSNLLYSLALSGVGKIKVIDNEKVKLEDVTTNILYSIEDVDKLRYKVAKKKIKSINPNVKFESISKMPKTKKDISSLIEDCDICVICKDIQSSKLYNLLNEVCFDKKIRWISGSLDGYIGRVGPAIIPGQTPCFKCYELRMKSNLEAYDEYIAFENYVKGKESPSEKYGSIYSLNAIVGNYISLEVLKMITNFDLPETYGKVLHLNFLSLESTLHNILKLPRCPVCSPIYKNPTVNIWED